MTPELGRSLVMLAFVIGLTLGAVLLFAALIRWLLRINEIVKYLKSIDGKLSDSIKPVCAETTDTMFERCT